MSTITVTYPVVRRPRTETLHCPKCGKPMFVFDLWKAKRGFPPVTTNENDKRYQGCGAECANCRIDTPDYKGPLVFYSSFYADLKTKVQNIEKAKILAATDTYSKQWQGNYDKWGDQLQDEIEKGTIDNLRETVKK